VLPNGVSVTIAFSTEFGNELWKTEKQHIVAVQWFKEKGFAKRIELRKELY
jgi:hypothetical protein